MRWGQASRPDARARMWPGWVVPIPHCPVLSSVTGATCRRCDRTAEGSTGGGNERRADASGSLMKGPRSSAGQSNGLLIRGSQVRILPGAPILRPSHHTIGAVACTAPRRVCVLVHAHAFSRIHPISPYPAARPAARARPVCQSVCQSAGVRPGRTEPPGTPRVRPGRGRAGAGGGGALRPRRGAGRAATRPGGGRRPGGGPAPRARTGWR